MFDVPVVYRLAILLASYFVIGILFQSSEFFNQFRGSSHGLRVAYMTTWGCDLVMNGRELV